jgi:hypothetical protein
VLHDHDRQTAEDEIRSSNFACVRQGGKQHLRDQTGALLEEECTMARNNLDIRRSLYVYSIQVFVIMLVLLATPVSALALVYPPGEPDAETTLPEYKSFIESVQNGEAGVLRGVYVPDVLAMPIIQQPVGYPGFVSQTNGEITQFRMASEVGNVGLLAHNYLSGVSFTNLAPGQEVRLIYGDGRVEYFIVDQVLRYQALQPYSPYSEFRDLDTNITITAEELFRKVYRGERHVTFQTCIEANGNSNWGRLFIVAQPRLFPYVEQQYIRDSLLPNIY